ncbi:MAG: DUF4124 domain-containing protein [Mizugakiibacter sp.]|uniref:DUF4124 domain-containing protein n=1 Tax=Mizugakiibacter sp. TaxID=1972610 RepID=UPI0031BE7E20|nr:DUF4124 domain-containing protein [Xanthomonadaceae bacterium]
MRARRLLPLALLAFAAVTAGGDYYKWTDANGTVHYAQQPPPGQRSQRVSVDAGSGITPPPEAAQPAADAAPGGGSALDKADAQYTERACAAARANLRLLESGKGMVISGDVDSGTKLGAEQRAKAITDARAQAAATCGKP